MFVHLLVFLGILGMSGAGLHHSHHSLNCDNCRLKNGVGYKPYPGDCSRYIQCDFSNNPTVLRCPHGLFWDQNSLVCNWPRFVRCYQPIKRTPTPSNSTVRPPQCDGTTRAVRGDNTKFEKYTGRGWVKFPCPPGTVYISYKCFCDHGYNPVVRPVCRPELYLPFNYDLRDHSGNHAYVDNEGVYLAYGRAYFKGYGGLRVNRFSNMDFRSTLQISFFYRAYNFVFYPGQALVSNGDCGKFGSIYIISIYRHILFRVTNEYGYTTYLSLPNYSLYRYTYVSLTIHGGYMYARVGFRYTYRSFRGNIAKSQCGLQIGRGYGYRNMIGYLDELRVFICKSHSYFKDYRGNWAGKANSRSVAGPAAQTEEVAAAAADDDDDDVDDVDVDDVEEEEMVEMEENLDDEVFQSTPAPETMETTVPPSNNTVVK